MAEMPIDFRTAPDRYRHWKLSTENGVAYLTMDVNEDGGLRPGYKLKLNSYDLGVEIVLADDGSSAVSLPELPLLAVLPGTGGLTRLVDKRLVRRDHADFFCTTAEGVRGKRARDWRLVDKLIPPSKLLDETKKIAEDVATKSKRPKDAKGIALPSVERTFDGDTLRYPALTVEIDRERRAAHFRVNGPSSAPPADSAAIQAQGAAFWPLQLARSVADAMLHHR